MSDRHSGPSGTEDNISVSETDSSSCDDTTSSAGEDASGSKEKELDGKMIAKPVVTSSDSNQSLASISSSAVLPAASALSPVSQRSKRSPSKSTASPKRSRSERHLHVFREIRRMSKERMRCKQMRRILRNFLINYPVASFLAAQTSRSLSLKTTSELKFPVLSFISDKAVAVEPSTSASAVPAKSTVKKTEASPKHQAADQFVSDRVNNLTDLLDEVDSLEKFIAQRKMFDTDAPGPSSRFPTQEGESIMHRLATEILETLKKLRNLAEGLCSWCLSQRATVEELKYYMNLLDAITFSSPDSHRVRQMLRTWEVNNSCISQLGDGTCLLEVENKLRAVQQSLIAESHVMYYKYWADKNKEKQDHSQKRD